MSDAEQPPRCNTLDCDNIPVEAGYCAEYAEVSPGALNENPLMGGHQASAEPRSDDDLDPNDPRTDEAVTKPPTEVKADDQQPPNEPPDARKAFTNATAWFHSQIDQRIVDHTDAEDEHSDRPTTARKYFHERGWTDATIDDAKLGWAPPSRTGPLNHLMRQGYSRDAVLGTDLFTEDFRPLWQGRYVLPYFDADGQPVYAISRLTGSEGGGAVGYDGHPADGLSGRYAKPTHIRPYAHISEPIYGLRSVGDGQPVLVTEGIADAITAHQAGYAYISPVTTRFKHDDCERLQKVLDNPDVSRAHIV